MSSKKIIISTFISIVMQITIGITSGIFYGIYLNDKNYSLKIILIYGSVTIFIVIYISNIIHELGHCIIAKWIGRKVVYFSVGAIVIYRSNNKINFKLKKYNLFGGGSIRCNSYNINSKEEMDKALRDTYIILMGGPIATLIVLLFCIMLQYFNVNNSLVHIGIILNLVYLVASFFTTGRALGDIFCMLNRGELDDTILNYLFMVGVSFDELTEYMYSNKLKDISRRIESNTIDFTVLSSVNQLIQYNMRHNIRHYDTEKIINYFFQNIEALLLNRDARYKMRLHIAIHSIIEWLITIQQDKIKSLFMLEKIKNDKLIYNAMSHKWTKYFIKKSEYLLGLRDTSTYISKRSVIDKSNDLSGTKII